MSNPQQPVDEVRIGRLKAAVWLNEAEDQNYHTVSFSRLYRTEDGEWRSTRSFRRRDLLLLRKLADQAHSRIIELQAEAADRRNPDEEAA